MSALLFAASESESDETCDSHNRGAGFGNRERSETRDIGNSDSVNNGSGGRLEIQSTGLDNQQRTGVSRQKAVGNAGRTKVELHHIANSASFVAAADERGRSVSSAITEVTDIGQKAAESADGELADRVGTACGKDNLIGES